MRIYRVLLSFSLSLCLSFSLGAKSFAGFEQLPLEVVSHIFSYLDAKELRQSGPINRACAGEAVEVNRRRWLAKVRKIEAIWTKFGPFIALPGGGELSPPITQELWIEVVGVSAAEDLDESVTNKENCPTTYREVLPAEINEDGDEVGPYGICPDHPVVFADPGDITSFSYRDQYHFRDTYNPQRKFWEKLNRIYRNAGLGKEWRLQTPEEYFWADTEGGRNPKLATDLDTLRKFTPFGGTALRSIGENVPNAFGFRRSGLSEATEDLVPWRERTDYVPRVYLVGGGAQAPADKNASDLAQWEMHSRASDDGSMARLVKMDSNSDTYAYTRENAHQNRRNLDQSSKEKVGVGRLRQLQKERDWWKTVIDHTLAEVMIKHSDPTLRSVQAKAYRSYSRVLRKGIGGEKDIQAANEYLLRAVEAGDIRALYKIRRYLFDSNYKNFHLEKSVSEIKNILLTKLSLSHDPFAALILSEIYLSKSEKDLELANMILSRLVEPIPDDYKSYFAFLQLKLIELSLEARDNAIFEISPSARQILIQTLQKNDWNLTFPSGYYQQLGLRSETPIFENQFVLEKLVQRYPQDGFVLFLYAHFLNRQGNYPLASAYAGRAAAAGELQALDLMNRIFRNSEDAARRASDRGSAEDPTAVKKSRSEK